MKNIILVLSLLLVIGCKSSKIELATVSDVENSLTYLASDELEGRNTGTKGIEKAAVFI